MTFEMRISLMIGVTLLCLGITLSLPPIPQPLEYHHFADQRTLWGIPHVGDVLSNLPFLFTGGWGLVLLVRSAGDRDRLSDPLEFWPLAVGFGGIFLIGMGSAWYHLHPTNDTLLWDRLPIAVGFMGIVCMMVAERIHPKAGLRLLVPLVVLAGYSVFYWHSSEMAGQGDLRWYGFVLYFPMLVIPLLMILFPPRYTGTRYLYEMLILYVAAKLFEWMDHEVYQWAGGLVSGHTLKHLFAAAATWSLVRYLRYRRAIIPRIP